MTFYEAFTDELSKLAKAPFHSNPFKRLETSGMATTPKEGMLRKLLPKAQPTSMWHVPVGKGHKWYEKGGLKKYRRGRLRGMSRVSDLQKGRA